MVFGSHMIKPDLNRGRLERNERGGQTKSGCKGMLNEAVLKCATASREECRKNGKREEAENEENGIALMLDFLCGWERIQKGNIGSHIPQMQTKRTILLHLHFFFFSYLSSDGMKKYLRMRSPYLALHL